MNAPHLPEYFIAFGDWGTNLAWHRLCRKGYRHVLAFGYEPRADAWIVVDAAFEVTALRVLPKENMDALISGLMQADAKILRCKVEARGQRRPRLFATCVTMIGHLLGLPRCAVFPYGLYRMLLRRGAVPAFERHGQDVATGLHAAGSRSVG